jgi:uncharacterized membrane protein
MRSQALAADRRGTTTVFFAASAVAMMAMAGLVVDSGNLFSAKRRLQGTTDLAAIAAATNLANATQAAGANAVVNDYDAAEVTNVAIGLYTPNPAIPPSQRFQPAPLGIANAALVTMTHQQPIFFGPIFALAGGNTSPAQNAVPITTQGMAVNGNVADFAIGSTVAAYNGGIVNAILGAAVGGNVNLSAISYQSLVSANVDLFGFARALAMQEGLVGGTYAQAFSGTVPMEEFLAALITVAPSAAGALSQLQSQAALGKTTVDLAKLLEFGPYANLSLSDPEPNVTATASALSLLQGAAQLGGAAHLISLTIAANIPGITSVTGMMTVGEPPQYSTLMAIDSTGSTVHTAQIRVFLTLGLAGTPPASVVNLPLYMEIGYGTAQLAGLSCNALDASSTTATLNVTPGLVNGWIGQVTAAQMLNYGSEPAVAAGTLVSLPLVTVTGTANAQVGNITPVQVQFSDSDIQNHVIKSTSTTDFVASLLQGLFTNTALQVNGVAIPGLPQAVMGVLNGAATPVDQVVSGVLQTAGVSVGQASTWIDGARCGAAMLAG